ncbi:sodium/proton antiporter NhaB [Salinisphaera sp. USBA-960]|uniref:sodium/proton antiporter NhaB n=1 Tax=Salinisphaera orenii TaxID=856731 RepID=UPI000DBE7B5F|nr:sodium/proton antiporter NhaB [Salifodinibacter halophilus]NNC25402.1 sodium/proton antiporter NhaB [Salifodinibacter halophilus]
MTTAIARTFLGHAPNWYKLAIVGFLVANPFIFAASGGFIAGWVLVFEFLFTLALALRCYPLAPGGLLAIEAVVMGMTTPEEVYSQVQHNLPVLLLLVFMVAGVYFLRELLLTVFTRIFLGVRSVNKLALFFCGSAAVLSAFLDALTVTAVIMAIAEGFYFIYHSVASGQHEDSEHNHHDDSSVASDWQDDLEHFRAFLRSLMMHAVVGTALGGVTTEVGEPQNLLIGHIAGWNFTEFFMTVAPVSIPVLVVGLTLCFVLQKLGWFGYGVSIPESVKTVLRERDERKRSEFDAARRVRLIAQTIVVGLLVLALAFHVAEVGLIGLALIVLTTSLTGIVEESKIGPAFEEALPFTALLTVFFAIVAVINSQHLFHPIMNWVLAFDGSVRGSMVYIINGVLSMISDNVFVASVYMQALENAVSSGALSQEQLQHLAVAVNTGTNIPSVATPNGQAAFLFLLTSALAPLIRLSYLRMMWMALPYTVVLSLTGLLCVRFLL